jgi:hypothetical protein
MATSYTSLLGLALPVTGELAGTWGDTVNNSITALLDTAVAGTTTLSTDADVTLSTTTGSANQARQAILLCSGARTAIRNITAPAQSKIYAVVNNTTGGYAVVIRGAGPTTGVSVANGKTAIVIWNGSDFVEVAPATATTATNLAGGAAGSLPYQSGAGATTFVSIGASNSVLTSNGTAPVWTTNTGTGNVVRATSPTIATPTITTSATVPLVIGGTGTTSTLTLRSTSGVGTTNADIIFQTGNNGATEAMRILNSGNVGIGTSSPSAKLSVIGNISTAEKTNAYIGVDVATSAGNGGDLTIKAGGGNGAGNTSGVLYLAYGRGNATASNGYMAFGRATSNNGTGLDANGEFMRLDAAGNLGISTASPSYLLSLGGNSDRTIGMERHTTSNTAGNSLNIRAGGATLGATDKSGGTVIITSGISTGTGTSSIAFQTVPSGSSGTIDNAPVERMRISWDGNVGIGTSSPVTLLDIVATANPTVRIGQTNTSGGECAIKFVPGFSGTYGNQQISAINAELRLSASTVGGTNAVTTFYTGSSTAERMRIDSSGNVGIGTTAALNKLDVVGSFGRGAPVTKTSNFTLAATENWVICNGVGTITVTFPAASSWTGREVMIKTIAAQTVVSASSNVVPLVGGAAGTAILAATAGKWATLVSDGTSWVIMSAA